MSRAGWISAGVLTLSLLGLTAGAAWSEWKTYTQTAQNKQELETETARLRTAIDIAQTWHDKKGSWPRQEGDLDFLVTGLQEGEAYLYCYSGDDVQVFHLKSGTLTVMSTEDYRMEDPLENAVLPAGCLPAWEEEGPRVQGENPKP